MSNSTYTHIRGLNATWNSLNLRVMQVVTTENGLLDSTEYDNDEDAIFYKSPGGVSLVVNLGNETSTNSTVESDDSYLDSFDWSSEMLLRYSPSVAAIYCVAYTLVFVLGIIGNSFVVAVVLRSPRMRTVTNYFIVNLALADILVLLFCLPATLLSNLFIRKSKKTLKVNARDAFFTFISFSRLSYITLRRLRVLPLLKSRHGEFEYWQKGNFYIICESFFMQTSSGEWTEYLNVHVNLDFACNSLYYRLY